MIKICAINSSWYIDPVPTPHPAIIVMSYYGVPDIESAVAS